MSRSQVDGVTVDREADLRAAIQRGVAATDEGRPFLIDVRVRKLRGGTESVWNQLFTVAA